MGGGSVHRRRACPAWGDELIAAVREGLRGRTYLTALIAKEVRAAVTGVDARPPGRSVPPTSGNARC